MPQDWKEAGLVWLTYICSSYSHYFKDDEFNVFMSAMSTIAQNSDPTNGPYNFIINCSPTDDIAAQCKASKSGSYAITDATVPKDDNDIKSMWLCPLFFTGDDTKNDLPSTADADKDKLDAWCKQDNYKKFTTAGPYKPLTIRPLTNSSITQVTFFSTR